MSGVRFLKMSGAGNDFVVVGPEGLAGIAVPLAEWTRRVCRRHHGVGADGALFVELADGGVVRVRFLNPDGTEAFCGNGSRCAARFARLVGLAGDRMTLATAAGEVPAAIRDDGSVELTLPPPVDGGAVEIAATPSVRWRRVDAGTPHAVAVVDDVDAVPLAAWGPAVRHAPLFGPRGTNVNVLSAGADGAEGIWRLRTFEKGVEAETLACGSGAVAAALVARRHGAAEVVRLRPTGGIPLTVTLVGPAERPTEARLAGEARPVFDGILREDGLPV